jgi:pilus assembly protein CpaB
LKRSNRLILLIGIFLAIVAFVGIVLVFQQNNGDTTVREPTELPTVYAVVDIPFGTQVTADQLESQTKPIDQRAPDAFTEVGLVIGRTVTTEVLAGKQLQEQDFAYSRGGQAPITPNIEQGLRAMAIQVDQVSGVGTLINVGDRVDLVAGFDISLLNVDPDTQAVTKSDVSGESVKLILQNMQVVGTLLPPPPAPTEGSTTDTTTAPPTTALTGQQEIVIVAATPQQSEVIKYAQLQGSITLVLRSLKDFKDADGNPVIPPPDPTTGIILKTLIDEYGVLPPEIVELVLPTGLRPTS